MNRKLKKYLFSAIKFPFKTCASCKYTFIGNKNSCPKCEFAYYSAYFVYGINFIWEFLFNMSYKRKLKDK